MTGTTISHYEIAEKLGGGDTGLVYKAKDLRLRRDVAIRFLPQQAAIKDDAWERFLIDFQTVAALNNPYIPTIYAIEEPRILNDLLPNEAVQCEIYIVMEYIEGRELEKIIKESSELLNIQDVLHIAKRIASGFKSAHKRGIIHGDLTSSSIWITKEDRVKVMNFGKTEIQALRGAQFSDTSVYSSPEQIQGKKIDSCTDIWSFGVVLYEMLTGKLPFDGNNSAELIDSILNEKPVPIHESRTEVPTELELFVNDLILKDSEARPNSFSLILNKLRKFSKVDAHGVRNIMIRFSCHRCHAKYKASPKKAGKEVTCKNCKTTIIIPGSLYDETN